MFRRARAFAQNNPTGALLADQEHRARVWLSFDQPLGDFGNLNVAALQRFDSGLPYSAVSNAFPVADFVTDPGYATAPSTVTYYFSDRGEFRWEDTTATDLAVNWTGGVAGLNLFVQGEVINAFDESAQVGGNTAVVLMEEFNPFTETPVEGVHWRKGSNFGNATSVNHYQLPRTYRVSLGLRF